MSFNLTIQNRQRIVQRIASFLHQLQPNENRSSLLQLAQKFEHACYTKAQNTKDYQNRIEKKLKAAKKAQEGEDSNPHNQVNEFERAALNQRRPGFYTNQSIATGVPFQNSNAGYNNANIRQSTPSSISSKPYDSFSPQNKVINSSNQHHSNNINNQPTGARSSRQLASATSNPQSHDFQSSNGFGRPGHLSRPNAHQQNRPIQNRNFHTFQPEIFSDGNLQVPEPIPFNALNIPDPIPIYAAGTKPEYKYGERKQIFTEQTSFQNERNSDEGGYYRQQKVLEMKRNHGIVLENFRRKSTEFLSTVKAKISQNGMAPQLEKLNQYIIYASNSLNYMERCENGHYPSEKSMAGLSVTIKNILSANKMIESAISRSKNTQQHLQQTSPPLSSWQAHMQPQKSIVHQPFNPLGSQCSNLGSQTNGQYRRQQSGNLQSQTETSKLGSEVGYGFGEQQTSPPLSSWQAHMQPQKSIVHQPFNPLGSQCSNLGSQTNGQYRRQQSGNLQSQTETSKLGSEVGYGFGEQPWSEIDAQTDCQQLQHPVGVGGMDGQVNSEGHFQSQWPNSQTLPQPNNTQTPIINVTVNVSNIGAGSSHSNASSQQTPQLVNISYQSNPSVGNQHGFGNQQAVDTANFDPNVQKNLSPLKQVNSEFDPDSFLCFSEEPDIPECFPKMQSQSSLDLDKPLVQPYVADSVKKETLNSQSVVDRSMDNSFEPSLPWSKSLELPQPPTFESSQVIDETDQSFVVKQETVLSNNQQIQNSLSTQKVNQISYGSQPLERSSAVKTEPPTSNQTFGEGITQPNLQRTAKEIKPLTQIFFHERSDARIAHTEVQPPLKKYKISFSDPHCQPPLHSGDYDGSDYSHDLTKLSCLLNQKLSPVIFQSNLSNGSLVFDCQNIFTVSIIFERLHEDELSSSPKYGKPLTVSVERRCRQPKPSTLQAKEDTLMTKMMGQPSDLNFSNQAFFRKVTAHSLQMLMHFLSRHENARGIILFCEWIQTYSCQESSGTDTRMMHSLEFDPDSQTLLPLHLRSHDGKLLSPEEAC
eukprot:CAMPEP_0117893604 /NCGR_PEP_ID=MMETSP0950-20121206/25432_1 /TAXON_ID=44440 /ORGANISM="Chattonella subsalsa, Strain CCMP2191" /LENGTH=1037 /DNA_ID=CAMNT_0005753909 /DNA_START=147 /DNA_END=3261 /DNA_ORIENTATION=-